MSRELTYTPVEKILQIRDDLRYWFRVGKAKSVEFRKEQLLQFAYMVQDNVERLQGALKKDLGRPALETNMLDVMGLISDALYAYKSIDSWVKTERAPFELNFFPFSPKIRKEPKGVVLIISPYNYPLFCLSPIVGAIAAGCAVVVKPSELTPATSYLLEQLFLEYMDLNLYRVVNGGVAETTQLLSLQWDHILFTGSGRVGRIVATAAAKHLTPVTLELGGKSPVVIDTNVDFELTARRLLWGKMVNAGQTCLAPDYVLIPQHVQGKLVEALKVEYKKFYGDTPMTSKSFSRICAPSHWERIDGLLRRTKGEIVLGGETDKSAKYIAPTVVQNVSFDDSLMSEELFGPVLPIVPVSNVEDAIKYINSHDHPLTLHVFSKSSKFREYVQENTLSGMVMENDCILQGGSRNTPFGGVGGSGYGAYKGKYSFDTFVHLRPSLSSPKWIDLLLGVRFPPYTDKKLKRINASLFPRIPYPRPGTRTPFNWKRWLFLTFTFAVIAMNRQRIAALITLKLGRILPGLDYRLTRS